MANTFIHFELNTDDVSSSKDFYRKLFKWKFKPTKGMPYTMIDTGSKTSGAGMQVKPMPQAPTAWLSYVEVDDVRKTLAKAQAAGAQPVVEYQPIPGMGAFAIFTDPAGAMLGLWEVEKKPKPARKPAPRKGANKKAAKAKSRR
jgi:predicted enzyme related to lactoylglutathione lyase